MQYLYNQDEHDRARMQVDLALKNKKRFTDVCNILYNIMQSNLSDKLKLNAYFDFSRDLSLCEQDGNFDTVFKIWYEKTKTK